jgi:ectoine hydroxylase-related dioxygenase (phytanoyl-CoA dioxygenase family)
LNFAPLAPAQRQAFEADGFLVVRRAVAPDQVERLIAASDRLAADFLSKPVVLDRPEYNHIDLRQGLLQEPELLELIDHAPTVALVAQLLTPNIHLHSTALIYKRPEDLAGVAFRRGWHRDMRIPADLGHECLPRVGIKICYCLTDFPRADTGITKMIRGSHLRTAPLVLHGDEVDPRGLDIVDLCLEAGDALLFENRTFHTAAPNLSQRTSKVLIYGYAYRWMKQEANLDPPDPALLEKSSPTRRQLLGGYRDVDTRPWALQQWAQRNGVLPPATRWTVPAEAKA